MKVKIHTENHITATDRKLLKSMAEDLSELEEGYNYGFSNRKRAKVTSIFDGGFTAMIQTSFPGWCETEYDRVTVRVEITA